VSVAVVVVMVICVAAVAMNVPAVQSVYAMTSPLFALDLSTPGKRKCSLCDVPVLVCLACCDSRKDKQEGVELKCDLCVEQGRRSWTKRVTRDV
jgi:hypothetical protein